MRNKPKSSKKIFPFVRTFNPANQNVKKILMKHWHLISGKNNLAQMYPNPPIVTCQSFKYSVVRAQLPSLKLHNSILEVIHGKGLMKILQDKAIISSLPF